MSFSDDYSDKVDRLLQLPTLQDEDPRATWVFRAVFRPAFHPECALSVFEVPSGVQIRLRTLVRRAGIPHWVEPALSCEAQPVAERWIPALYSLVDARLDANKKDFGIDGITIRCERWEHAGESWSGEVWCPSPTRYPEAWRFCQVLLEVGKASLTWEASHAALDAMASYLAEE